MFEFGASANLVSPLKSARLRTGIDMNLTTWLRRALSRSTYPRSRGVRRVTRRRQQAIAYNRRWSAWVECLETRVLLAADFGDAPDTGAGTGPGNYETLAAHGGPSHIIDVTKTTLFLGKTVDGDDGTLQNAAANADDQFTDGGRDDEDGVLDPANDLIGTIGAAPTVTLLVTNTTGSAATLSGWIDYNNDGVFDNATERAQATVNSGTTDGRVTLTFPSVPEGFTGKTYARFRLSTDAAASNSTGAAGDGEVEDYVFTITAPSDGSVDSFLKIAHELNGGPSLHSSDNFGSSVASLGDLDGDGVADLAVGATGDDTGGVSGGAVHVLLMKADGTVKSSTKIANRTEGGPTLANGDRFGRSVASLSDLDGDGVADLAVGAFGDGTGGTSYRGAVHVLLLNADGTVKSSTKIAHELNGGPSLADRDFFGSSVASLGDLDGDGVADLAVGAYGDDTGGTDRGAVHVLMLNADGTVKNSTKIAHELNGGPTLPNFNNFGISVASLGDLDGDGVADLAVGSDEDNFFGATRGAVQVLFLAPLPIDFGDAPSIYPVTLADNGARHTIGSLFLGSLIDAEADGQPDDEAGQGGSGGDDNNGDADEDGVFAAASIVAMSGKATRSSVSVISSGAGKLDGWIDFNQDGDWVDVGEQIFTSTDVVAGVNLLSFNVPAGATPGTTFARFRLSSAGGLAPTGLAPDGEVEDYIVSILDGDAAGGAAAEIDASVPGTLDVFADGSDVVVRSGAIELFRAPWAALNRINIVGTQGDDTLNVANLDGIFAGLVGGNAGAGYDTLRLTGDGQELDLTQIADSDLQGFESIDITGSGANTLKLNVAEVLNISPTTGVLRVRHDADDTVSYGEGWRVELPRIVGEQYVHVLIQGDATVEVVNPFAFHNPLRALDTNRDGNISPVDALIVINKINDGGSGVLPTPISLAGITEFFYYDTNKDGSIAPIDVLVVINFLNDPAQNGEGESGTTSLAVAVVPNAVAWPSARIDVLTLSRSSSPAPRRLASRNDRTDYNAAQNREANAIRSSDRLPRTARYSAMVDELLGDDDLSVLRPYFD